MFYLRCAGMNATVINRQTKTRTTFYFRCVGMTATCMELAPEGTAIKIR